MLQQKMNLIRPSVNCFPFLTFRARANEDSWDAVGSVRKQRRGREVDVRCLRFNHSTRNRVYQCVGKPKGLIAQKHTESLV